MYSRVDSTIDRAVTFKHTKRTLDGRNNRRVHVGPSVRHSFGFQKVAVVCNDAQAWALLRKKERVQ